MSAESSRERARPRSTQTWDGDAVRSAFDAAAASKAWTLGYRSVDVDRLACGDLAIVGEMPADLRGVYFRNGPARHDRGGQRYGHRWDGDGMVQRFSFADGKVSHLGRFVETRKYVAERAAGRLLSSTFGTHVPGTEALPKDLDDANVANISVMPLRGDLLALWEAGSAYRLEPDSLDTLGPKRWTGVPSGSPFSAHPRIEPDGAIWNFGVDPAKGELIVYRIDADGASAALRTIAVGDLPAIHDFAVTERHLVFLLPPLVPNIDRVKQGASFAQSCEWKPSLGMRVLTLSKADGSARWYDAEPGCLFHIANAWEDQDGTIRLHYMRSDDPMSLLAGWSVMRGEYRHRPGAFMTALVLEPETRRARQEKVAANESEFPVVVEGVVGRRHREVLCVERSQERSDDVPGFDEVALIDVDSGKSRRFSFGDQWMVEEHVFAGPRGGPKPWIVGTALDLRARQTVVSVFDATRLEAGPIGQARLPYSVPLGLHGVYQHRR